MKVNLKPENIRLIRNYCKYNVVPNGKTIQAIYKLIQKRGAPIESDEPRYNGIMCLLFAKGEYIALKRSGLKDSFYPCMMQNLYITADNI